MGNISVVSIISPSVTSETFQNEHNLTAIRISGPKESISQFFESEESLAYTQQRSSVMRTSYPKDIISVRASTFAPQLSFLNINVIFNQPPRATSENITSFEDVVFSIIDLSNLVVDPEGDSVLPSEPRCVPRDFCTAFVQNDGETIDIEPGLHIHGDGVLEVIVTDALSNPVLLSWPLVIWPVNDKPLIEGPSSLHMIEDTWVSLGPSWRVIDVDFDILTLTLTASGDAQPALNPAPETSVREVDQSSARFSVAFDTNVTDVSGNLTSTLVISGNPAVITSSIASIMYRPPPNYNSDIYASLSIHANLTDGESYALHSTTIIISAVNDPMASLKNITLTVAPDSLSAFNYAQLSIEDFDGDIDFESATVIGPLVNGSAECTLEKYEIVFHPLDLSTVPYCNFSICDTSSSCVEVVVGFEIVDLPVVVSARAHDPDNADGHLSEGDIIEVFLDHIDLQPSLEYPEDLFDFHPSIGNFTAEWTSESTLQFLIVDPHGDERLALKV